MNGQDAATAVGREIAGASKRVGELPSPRAVVAGLLALAVAAAAGCGMPPPGTQFQEGQSTLTWTAPLFRASPGVPEGPSGRIQVVETATDSYSYDKDGVKHEHHSLRWSSNLQVRGLSPYRTYAYEAVGGAGTLTFATEKDGTKRIPMGGGAAVPTPGTTIHVKDPSGPVLLGGIVPDWRGSPTRGGMGRAGAEGSYQETLAIRTEWSVATGRERIELRLKGFLPGDPADIRMRDAAGSFVAVGGVTPGENGRGSLVWDSRHGDPLPLGAFSVRSLDGSAVEVVIGGVPVLEVEMP